MDGDKWNGEGYTWWDQIYKINALGLGTDSIVSTSMFSDSKNTTYRTLYFDQATTGMSRQGSLLVG